MIRSILSVLGLVGLLVGCSDDNSGPPAQLPSETTLSVLAGSELKDVEPLLAQLEKATGVRLQFEYSGTLDGVERIQSGEAFDTAWFSHAKYLMLDPVSRSKVKASEKIMFSPVVLGVKASRARALGWEGKTDISWKDIAQATAAGRFSFAMTNPTSSNTGFSALMGMAAAFAGKADALTEKDVEGLKLTGLFKGQKLTAGSSGWLAERFVAEQGNLDGMINYESVLLGLNAQGLKEQLQLIYPRDGLVTADYPLLLMSEAKRPAYDKVVAWLKGEEAQRWLMQNTRRRPANPAVVADPVLFPKALQSELPFPGRIEVVNALLLSYLNEQRRPSHAFFVLDVSGSMAGERIEGLRQALARLAGEDKSLSGRFAQFQNRERITFIPFSTEVEEDLVVEADMGNTLARNTETLSQIQTYATRLETRGGTALYDALAEAYRRAATAMKADPQRYYTIVAMTDGESNQGMGLAQFRTYYASLPEEVRRVRVFTVLFGDGDATELQAIADLTGGRTFDSRKTSLSFIFKGIRGYQ